MTMLCVDISAWNHAVDPGVAARWRDALDSDVVAICDQVRLEILYSARSAPDYDDLAAELGSLPSIPCGAAVFARALEVQRLLAHVGGLHHRSVKIADLVIAAAAELVGATVWHYDSHFDRISEVTRQATEWIAPRGSL